MKIVVASQSALKVEICKHVVDKFYSDVDLVTVKAASGVAEQPFDHVTVDGAFNRLHDAKSKVLNADLYISIENGIFNEDGRYMDRAVAVVSDFYNSAEIATSEGVEFPAASVEKTKTLGIDKWTVGKVMAEDGLVAQHDDPHLTLSGKSRKIYLEEALTRALTAHQKRAKQMFPS